MNIPRKHHYVPKFYLRGFTKESSSDGVLWVVDLARQKQWRSTPANSGLTGDFYKGDLGPDVDSMWFERSLGESVEPVMSQVLDFVLDTKEIPPCGMARDVFLNLVATSLVRGPSMRAMNSDSFDSGMKNELRELAATDEGRTLLQERLEKTGISLDQLLRLDDDGAFQYDFDRITHLKTMMAQVDAALYAFAQREWTVRVVADDAPDLVCSDSPVGILPLAREVPLVWLDPNALLVMPLNRRCAAFGSLKKTEQPEFLGIRQVAQINATVIRGAAQVYCSEPEFTTLNRGEYQRVMLQTCKSDEAEPV